MSDSAGDGESGGVAGAGQDSEADSEPPHHALHLLSKGEGETSEDGAPTSAKRPRMTEEVHGVGEDVQPDKMHEEMPTETDLLQENSAQSIVLSLLNKVDG